MKMNLTNISKTIYQLKDDSSYIPQLLRQNPNRRQIYNRSK